MVDKLEDAKEETSKVDVDIDITADDTKEKPTNGTTELPAEKQNNTVKKMPKKPAPPIPKKMFNYDRYATVKSAGIGLLTITLIVDASVRLRKVVEMGADGKWYLPMLILISVLLGLLALEGILLVFLSTQNIQNPRKQGCLQRLNITCTIFAGIITIISVIVLNIMADSGLYVGIPNPVSNGTVSIPTTPPGK
uniref:Ninjurin-1 n=1 Tax=Ciona intestinalis TaxID=7719 RepID=F6QNI1_CIOIN|nr:ninjurin-1 isoform X3 [Ciona intestinalis]|eukprot:XP_002128344.1 ninjurin-1 isoform X3 [Ciona intestinalis]